MRFAPGPPALTQWPAFSHFCPIFVLTMKRKVYLAVDLGASSGRVLAGLFDGHDLDLEEVHRFGNGPVNVNGRLYWRTFDLWANILVGLREAGRRYGDADRQRGRRHLGRRLRAARSQGRAAGRAGGLPRRAHAGRARARVRRRAARGNLRGDGPAVHGAQHALSTARREAVGLAAAGPPRVACCSCPTCSTGCSRASRPTS